MLLVDVGDGDCFIALCSVLIIFIHLILTIHIETGCFSHWNEPVVEKLFFLRELFDYVCLFEWEHILAAENVECG